LLELLTMNDIINSKVFCELITFIQFFYKVVLVAKNHGSISNQKVQEIAEVSKTTATRDLTELVEKWNLISKSGEKKSVLYSLKRDG
jgi:hypothetical protein